MRASALATIDVTAPRPAKPRTRPDLREKAVRYGTAVLSDAELVALVLGTGIPGASVARLANLLLEDSQGLAGLTCLEIAELAAKYGIGRAKASRVAAALELGKRAFRQDLEQERLVFSSGEDVVRWARPRLSALEHEEVWLLSLDGQNGLKAARRVAQGGLHGCALTPKDILRPALRAAATAIILLHNHPSGSPEPSPEDLAMTEQLAIASQVVGIELLDHLIVARQEYCSLAERGVIP